MKNIVTTFLTICILALVSTMPTSAGTVSDLNMAPASAGSGEAIKPCPRGTYRVRRNTSTGKKLLNAALASGVGAALGGGIGGGRGALVGAGTGAGGYLTYRYVRDRRGRCVRRVVR